MNKKRSVSVRNKIGAELGHADTKKDEVVTFFRNKYTEWISIALCILVVVLFLAKVLLRKVYHIPFFVILGTGALLNILLALRNRNTSKRLSDVFALFAAVLIIVFLYLVLRVKTWEIF